MSYLKGKDIKCPFDCIWNCMTRKFEPICTSYASNSHLETHNAEERHHYIAFKPEGFEKW